MTQSIPTAGHRALTLAVSLWAASLPGGCGLSSITSGLGSGIMGGESKTSETSAVSEAQLLAAAQAGDGAALPSGGIEVAAGCPRFTTWPRENFITIYEPGRAGDGMAVIHRGEITKTARECTIEPGRVTVRYGFSGRILLGPKGKSGTVSLPVAVFVTDDKRNRLTSDKLTVDVNVSLENPIGYFSAVRTVTFDISEGSRPGDYQVFVAFDRGVPGAG